MRTCNLMWCSCTKTYEHACLYVFSVFSLFGAHFYPPLHHNGKGSITVGKVMSSSKSVSIDLITCTVHLVCDEFLLPPVSRLFPS